MKLFLTYLLSFTVVLLFGCSTTATMERLPRTASASKFAPLNEREMATGRIYYYLDSSEKNIAKAREDAYRQMHNACQGDYRIVSELQEDQPVAVSYGVVIPASKVVIEFACASVSPTAGTTTKKAGDN